MYLDVCCLGTPHCCSTQKKDWIWRGGRPLLPCFGVVPLSLMMSHTISYPFDQSIKHAYTYTFLWGCAGPSLKALHPFGPFKACCNLWVSIWRRVKLGFYIQYPKQTSQQKRTTSCRSLGPRFYISHVWPLGIGITDWCLQVKVKRGEEEMKARKIITYYNDYDCWNIMWIGSHIHWVHVHPRIFCRNKSPWPVWNLLPWLFEKCHRSSLQ